MSNPWKCDDCDSWLAIGDWPICPHGRGAPRLDLLDTPFEVSHEGVTYTMSTLGDVRRLERQSEERARGGEGQQINWRDFSNDRSNRERNSLGENPRQHSLKELQSRDAKGRPRISHRATKGDS